jgi:aminoglycoside 3-N-acetyltransferase
MLTFRDFSTAFRKLEIDHHEPVIAHASLSSFGEVQSGVDTLLGALLANFNTLVMPVFTYKTMVTPEAGPPDNGIRYGSSRDGNLMAEFFRPGMPADRMMGRLPDALRRHPKAQRSSHPILSFTGINAAQVLESQSIREPLNPIGKLVERQGWVLLLGVDQTVDTSIHYAEKLAGRKQFVRWALTPKGILECPGWPGCSLGFQAIAPKLEDVTRQVLVGSGQVQAVPLGRLVEAACGMIAEDPLALLCGRDDCERCQAVRQSVHPTAVAS